MNDGAAILQAIIDDPADDLPRLAYADWLDEQGRTGERIASTFTLASRRGGGMMAREWLKDHPLAWQPE